MGIPNPPMRMAAEVSVGRPGIGQVAGLRKHTRLRSGHGRLVSRRPQIKPRSPVLPTIAPPQAWCGWRAFAGPGGERLGLHRAGVPVPRSLCTRLFELDEQLGNIYAKITRLSSNHQSLDQRLRQVDRPHALLYRRNIVRNTPKFHNVVRQIPNGKRGSRVPVARLSD